MALLSEGLVDGSGAARERPLAFPATRRVLWDRTTRGSARHLCIDAWEPSVSIAPDAVRKLARRLLSGHSNGAEAFVARCRTCEGRGRGQLTVCVERLMTPEESSMDASDLNLGPDECKVRCFLRLADCRRPLDEGGAHPTPAEMDSVVNHRDGRFRRCGLLRLGDAIAWAALVAVDGRQRCVHVRLFAPFPRWTFSCVLLATPLRTLQSPLLAHLLSPGRQTSMGYGFLTLDQGRRVVCLQETDGLVEKVPLVGVWVDLAGGDSKQCAAVTACDAADIVHSPFVWEAAARFVHSLRIRERVWVAERTLLVMIVHCVASPQPGKDAAGVKADVGDTCCSFFEARYDESVADGILVAPAREAQVFELDCPSHSDAMAESQVPLSVRLLPLCETIPGVGGPENPEEDVPPQGMLPTRVSNQMHEPSGSRSPTVGHDATARLNAVCSDMSDEPRSAPPRPHTLLIRDERDRTASRYVELAVSPEAPRQHSSAVVCFDRSPEQVSGPLSVEHKERPKTLQPAPSAHCYVHAESSRCGGEEIARGCPEASPEARRQQRGQTDSDHAMDHVLGGTPGANDEWRMFLEPSLHQRAPASAVLASPAARQQDYGMHARSPEHVMTGRDRPVDCSDVCAGVGCDPHPAPPSLRNFGEDQRHTLNRSLVVEDCPPMPPRSWLHPADRGPCGEDQRENVFSEATMKTAPRQDDSTSDEAVCLRQLVGMQQMQLLHMQQQLADLHKLVAGMAPPQDSATRCDAQQTSTGSESERPLPAVGVTTASLSPAMETIAEQSSARRVCDAAVSVGASLEFPPGALRGIGARRVQDVAVGVGASLELNKGVASPEGQPGTAQERSRFAMDVVVEAGNVVVDSDSLAIDPSRQRVQNAFACVASSMDSVDSISRANGHSRVVSDVSTGPSRSSLADTNNGQQATHTAAVSVSDSVESCSSLFRVREVAGCAPDIAAGSARQASERPGAQVDRGSRSAPDVAAGSARESADQCSIRSESARQSFEKRSTSSSICLEGVSPSTQSLDRASQAEAQSRCSLDPEVKSAGEPAANCSTAFRSSPSRVRDIAVGVLESCSSRVCSSHPGTNSLVGARVGVESPREADRRGATLETSARGSNDASVGATTVPGITDTVSRSFGTQSESASDRGRARLERAANGVSAALRVPNAASRTMRYPSAGVLADGVPRIIWPAASPSSSSAGSDVDGDDDLLASSDFDEASPVLGLGFGLASGTAPMHLSS